jgi:hypothetical protein
MPACETVTDCPLTSIVAERALATVFGTTLTAIEPGPVPLAGDTVNQPAVDDAVHAQPASVETDRVALPPALVTDTVIGDTTKVHWAAACVTLMG